MESSLKDWVVDHILLIDTFDHDLAKDRLNWYAQTLPWLGLIAAVKEKSKQLLAGEQHGT